LNLSMDFQCRFSMLPNKRLPICFLGQTTSKHPIMPYNNHRDTVSVLQLPIILLLLYHTFFASPNFFLLICVHLYGLGTRLEYNRRAIWPFRILFYAIALWLFQKPHRMFCFWKTD